MITNNHPLHSDLGGELIAAKTQKEINKVCAKYKDIYAAMEDTAIVVLESYGNPDKNQFSPLSPKLIKPCVTYEDAVKHCKNYIQEYELGGGNWGSGFIMHPIKGIIAYVSYNGRVWESDGNLDYRIPRNEITDIKAAII